MIRTQAQKVTTKKSHSNPTCISLTSWIHMIFVKLCWENGLSRDIHRGQMYERTGLSRSNSLSICTSSASDVENYLNIRENKLKTSLTTGIARTNCSMWTISLGGSAFTYSAGSFQTHSQHHSWYQQPIYEHDYNVLSFIVPRFTVYENMGTKNVERIEKI